MENESFTDYLLKNLKDFREFAFYGSSPSERRGAYTDLNKLISLSDNKLENNKLINEGQYELDFLRGRPTKDELYLSGDNKITHKVFDELYGTYTGGEEVSKEDASDLMARGRNLELPFFKRYSIDKLISRVFNEKKDKKAETLNDVIRQLKKEPDTTHGGLLKKYMHQF